MDGSDGSEYCPFELPEDEYGELMFSRRLENRSVSLVASESRRGSAAADADGKRKILLSLADYRNLLIIFYP
jgi:MRG-binding protein